MRQNSALLIIDIINEFDFEGSENLLHHTRPMVKPLLQLKKLAKEQGLPVIYVNDNYGLWREDVGDLIKLAEEGIGKEIIEQFKPEKDDFFIIKPKHSGFYGTQLETLLNDLKVDNLILTGIAGDFCVMFTAFDAYMREYGLWVPSDCIASETAQDNDNALQLMHRSMSVHIAKSTEGNIEEVFK